MKQFHVNLKTLLRTSLVMLAVLCFSLSNFAQVPAYGTTGFNNQTYDQVPFALGVAYPNPMQATNVAGTGWNAYIGAIGSYVITQVNTGSVNNYNGAITATNVTPTGFPTLYQTFAFTSTNNSLFKLNSIKVKIDNSSASPVPMILAGVVNGQNTGSTVSFVAMPGSNWTTISTAINPNFTNINGIIIINLTGTTAVAEMAVDDINISAPIVQTNIPSFTTQPSNKTICSSASTSFTGVATNAAAYFWLMSTDGLIWNQITAANAGTTFSGYNSNTLTVTNPGIALNGLYLGLTAVNASGVNKGSNAARLFVNAAPTLGKTITLTSIAGGVWSSLNNAASIVSNTGVLTGTNLGTAVIKYTLTSGGCTSTAGYNVTVSNNTVTPTIQYALGSANPQRGAGGAFCANRTFTVVGSPAGGTWSATGAVSVVANTGVVTTSSTPGTGSVTYTYANAAGCTNSRSINGAVTVCPGPRGVASNSISTSTEALSIYPNPARNVVNFNADFVSSGGQIIVTNLMGKQVKTQPLSLGNNSIDISNLSKGFYLINVITNEGKRTQKLFVE